MESAGQAALRVVLEVLAASVTSAWVARRALRARPGFRLEAAGLAGGGAFGLVGLVGTLLLHQYGCALRSRARHLDSASRCLKRDLRTPSLSEAADRRPAAAWFTVCMSSCALCAAVGDLALRRRLRRHAELGVHKDSREGVEYGADAGCALQLLGKACLLLVAFIRLHRWNGAHTLAAKGFFGCNVVGNGLHALACRAANPPEPPALAKGREAVAAYQALDAVLLLFVMLLKYDKGWIKLRESYGVGLPPQALFVALEYTGVAAATLYHLLHLRAYHAPRRDAGGPILPVALGGEEEPAHGGKDG